ncbi:MAG: hypothetical protein NTY19_35225, partial [Planctomycetota bacterium]|nr:hypothetical protein [Planctomycetota bacterium]
MTSPLRLFQGLLAKISRRTQTRRRHRQRRLLLEPLEHRALLAANFGAIAGTVFIDKTGNGFTPADDIVVPGVTVNLYKGSVSTPPYASQSTDALGKYIFQDLAADTYLVQQQPGMGLVPPAVQTVTISAPDVTDAENPNATVGTLIGDVIDSFDIGAIDLPQSVVDGPDVTHGVFSGAPTVAIGNARKLYVNWVHGLGEIALYVNRYGLSPVLTFSTDPEVNGDRKVTWDGRIDGNFDPTGLGGVDLTADDQWAFRLALGADHDCKIILTVYTDGNDYSSRQVSIPGTSTGTVSQVPVPFPTSASLNSWLPAPTGSGANFKNVGAITLEITTDIDALDGQINDFGRLRAMTANLANLQSDLVITKTDSSLTYTPGGLLTYMITVTNSGPSDVVGATVADTIPATLTGVTWTSSIVGAASVTSGGTGSGNSLAATVNVSAGAGNSVVFNVTGTALASAIGNLDNTATVQPPPGTIDPTPDNNTAMDRDTATPQNDVGVTKVDSKGGSSITPSTGTVVPGTSFIYTITVSNAGPSTATNVTVSDPVPSGLTSFVWSGNGRT